MLDHVVEVGEAEWEERVLGASRERPVVVDFWAGWCQPCRVLGPVLERLAEEHAGRFILAKVDVDANQALAARYGVQGIPAVKAFRDGEAVSEFVGAQPEDVVRAWLREVLPSEAEPIAAEGRRAEEGGDPGAAEAAYRRALDADPGLEDAIAGLARVRLAAGDHEEARVLAERLPQNPEARSIAARARLAAAAPASEELRSRADADPEAALAVAAAEAARGDHGDALERCLRLVRSGGEGRDRARELMVAIFEALGEDHPLVREYRPRLASALY